MESDEVRRQWAEREGEYSPEYYAYRGPDERSESIRRLLTGFVGREASVFEVGCSAGRHLAHLHNAGFDRLSGVEINDEAVETMRETYPDLADDGQFYLAAVEDLLPTFDDGAFDAVFSVQTLQHIHPDDEWVFDELVRVADDLVITVENERAADGSTPGPEVTYVNDEFPLYFRDWNRVFTQRGLAEVASEQIDIDTLRAFRHSPDDG